jgi:dipeptidyl aminopeptidase/acylaminoacyl peptidase
MTGAAFVEIPSARERLEALHFARAGAPLVLFCHGFPGIHKHMDLAERMFDAGFGVLLLKYRGVDGSSGYFDFMGAVEDVAAAIRYAARLDVASGGIGLFGYSAGAYYALAAAADAPVVKAVCALSPVFDLPRAARADFENIHQLMLNAHSVIRVRSTHDLVASFAELWQKHHLPEALKRLTQTPLLIIDGDDHTHGDPQQSRSLYEAANEPKRLHWLGNAGHYFEAAHERDEISDELAAFFTERLGSDRIGTESRGECSLQRT